MLTAANIVAFVSTSDADRSRDFYEGVLGLRLIRSTPLALIFDARGTMLRVTIVEDLEPAAFTVLGWQVADIDHTVVQLGGRGVAFERFADIEQDESGIWEAPDGGLVAWFRDPDGNLLSITEG